MAEICLGALCEKALTKKLMHLPPLLTDMEAESPKPVVQTERDHWNACRFVEDDPKGHYESYFLRANHPERPLAFWVRYTLFSAKGRPADAVGEQWAIFFDGERKHVTTIRAVRPIAFCQFSPNRLNARIGKAMLTDQHAAGQVSGLESNGLDDTVTRQVVNTIKWDLRYSGEQAPVLLLPKALYKGRFPRAKAVVGLPNARFEGDITINGQSISTEGWIGSQNHNWGRRHTDEYAWGQVCGFDNAPNVFMECATVMLKTVGVEMPQMTVLVLRLEDEELRLNSLLSAVRAKASYDYTSWRITSVRGEYRVSVVIKADPQQMVGLTYYNPAGGQKTCLNTKLASCEVTIERDGYPPRFLQTRHRAAFEILTDRTDHGIEVVV